MSLKCGIVGLPNVGKSTFFNAVTCTSKARAANFPFATIDPNEHKVNVEDERLEKLASLYGSQELLPATLEMVDIAGLVRGAHKGEGLGNEFLGHIRDVDLIIYFIRCFEGDIIHVEGSVDPIRDLDIIELELIAADAKSLEKRIPNLEKKAKQDKKLQAELDFAQKLLLALQELKPARQLTLPADDIMLLHTMQLLTSKPLIYICNVGENELDAGNQYTTLVEARAREQGIPCLLVSAKIEEEIAAITDPQERKEMLEGLGIKEACLNQVVRSCYKRLGMITFFTAGPKEARAWTIPDGTLAPQAAGVIHSDFERGFIRAEVMSYKDCIEHGGETGCRDKGCLRQEGKEYRISDGDVVHFRFNV